MTEVGLTWQKSLSRLKCGKSRRMKNKERKRCEISLHHSVKGRNWQHQKIGFFPHLSLMVNLTESENYLTAVSKIKFQNSFLTLETAVSFKLNILLFPK